MSTSAIAIFNKPGSKQITGYVEFVGLDEPYGPAGTEGPEGPEGLDDPVQVIINLRNVPLGIHGIHIHEKSIDFNNSTDYCKQALGHFNGSEELWSPDRPHGTKHGSFFYDTERHVGDLCNNIMSTSADDGTVIFSYVDDLISLNPRSPNYIVGRSVVIHAQEDDEGMYNEELHDSDSESSVSSVSSMSSESPEIQTFITGNAGNRIACANIVQN